MMYCCLKIVTENGITDILTRANFCVDDFFEGDKVDKDVFRGIEKSLNLLIKYMEREQ